MASKEADRRDVFAGERRIRSLDDYVGRRYEVEEKFYKRLERDKAFVGLRNTVRKTMLSIHVEGSFDAHLYQPWFRHVQQSAKCYENRRIRKIVSFELTNHVLKEAGYEIRG